MSHTYSVTVYTKLYRICHLKTTSWAEAVKGFSTNPCLGSCSQNCPIKFHKIPHLASIRQAILFTRGSECKDEVKGDYMRRYAPVGTKIYMNTFKTVNRFDRLVDHTYTTLAEVNSRILRRTRRLPIHTSKSTNLPFSHFKLKILC